ncbi:MAG: hypothetical protein IPO90_09055 [Flavobacteriales bacterium]|nr:hypothetical protein [Flavobacteriales bacterium]MBL0046423.1 hypothetical protein [Flavobacteriales bacterium]
MKILIIVIGLVFLFAACKKEEVMPATPEISLLSVSTQSVVQFTDRVSLRFAYKDGDGDLGQVDPDDYTLWVKDARLNTADGYHIPPLAPEGEAVPIQGELTMELNALFLLGNSTQEETTYTVYLTDRAGNSSNTFVTGAIIILQDSI